jgi:hypothetical protein
VILLLFAIVNLLCHPASVGIKAEQLFYHGTKKTRRRKYIYGSFGVVHESKETTRDEQLAVCLQRVKEQFVA